MTIASVSPTISSPTQILIILDLLGLSPVWGFSRETMGCIYVYIYIYMWMYIYIFIGIKRLLYIKRFILKKIFVQLWQLTSLKSVGRFQSENSSRRWFQPRIPKQSVDRIYSFLEDLSLSSRFLQLIKWNLPTLPEFCDLLNIDWLHLKITFTGISWLVFDQITVH